MKPYGKFKKKILIIGRNPEKLDDQMNKPFQDKAGQLFRETFKSLGIDLFEDCLVTFACSCKSRGGSVPTNYEIDCCRKEVLRIIDDNKPALVILLGNAALYSVIGHRYKHDLGKIEKWRGWNIPDQEFQTWVCPTYSPQYILDDKKGIAKVIWKQDLKNALSTLKVEFPVHIEPTIEYLDDLKELDTIQDGEIAFDYETTGLKPQAEEHRIVCCSVAVNENKVYTFIIPNTKREVKPFLRLLANPNVKKMAQNMKFEDTWSNVCLNQEVVGWSWDTMQVTHILDNRVGITGLKFQVYVQFGVIDYSSDVEPYLKAVDGTANGFNRVLEFIKKPKGEVSLLRYCALDSIYEFRLAKLQQKIIGYE